MTGNKDFFLCLKKKKKRKEEETSKQTTSGETPPPRKKLLNHLGVCLDFKVVVTQMALHAELVDGGGVVIANLAFFRIVTHTHANVAVASPTPNVVRHLEPVTTNRHFYVLAHEIIAFVLLV